MNIEDSATSVSGVAKDRHKKTNKSKRILPKVNRKCGKRGSLEISSGTSYLPQKIDASTVTTSKGVFSHVRNDLYVSLEEPNKYMVIIMDGVFAFSDKNKAYQFDELRCRRNRKSLPICEPEANIDNCTEIIKGFE